MSLQSPTTFVEPEPEKPTFEQIYERRCICVICGQIKDVSKFHTTFQLALEENKFKPRQMFTLIKNTGMEYTYYIGTCKSCYEKIQG